MVSREALALAVIALAVLVLVYQARQRGESVGEELNREVQLGGAWAARAVAPPAARGGAPSPFDREVQTRNAVYMSPAALAAAEQQAWAPYTANAAPAYDVMKGRYPGSDLTQQMGNYQEGDWGQQIADLALDARTREQHRQWVDEVGPFSQGAFTVDNLDEAVAMSQHRVGITAFRQLAPAQSSCTLQLTERDAALNTAHFKPFNF